jgi:tetratricopeptide (TPR) repeat protein
MAAKPETDTVLQAVRCILSDRFQYDLHGSTDAWPGLRDLLPSTIAWCDLARAEAEAAVGDLYLLNTVGGVLHDVNGDIKSALTVFTEAHQWAEKVLPKKHPHIARSMGNLASSLTSLGRYKEALKLAEETLALWKEILPKNHPQIEMAKCKVAWSLWFMGRFSLQNLLWLMGRHMEAEAVHEVTLLFARHLVPQKQIGKHLFDLASSLSSLSHHEEARLLF